MKVIQELIGYFERKGKLTPEDIEKLINKGLLAADAPGNMVALCKPIGKTYYFRVHGEERGNVWGTDIYTGDSALPAASVHAGAVELGEAAVVKVTVVEPLPQYRGSTRNGITSQSYGQYSTAYRVDPVGGEKKGDAL
jgi:LCCL domain